MRLRLLGWTSRYDGNSNRGSLGEGGFVMTPSRLSFGFVRLAPWTGCLPVGYLDATNLAAHAFLFIFISRENLYTNMDLSSIPTDQEAFCPWEGISLDPLRYSEFYPTRSREQQISLAPNPLSFLPPRYCSFVSFLSLPSLISCT